MSADAALAGRHAGQDAEESPRPSSVEAPAPGAGGAPGEERRTRLLLAMIDTVEKKGYEAATVADVIALAGLSRKTFYEYFANKQECLLAAADLVVEVGLRRVRRAYEQSEGRSQRAGAAIGALFASAAARPGALRLSLVEVAAAGAAGIERRERTLSEYERFLREGFELDAALGPVTDIALKGVTGGLNGVLYRRVMRGEAARLPRLVGGLIEWVSSYYPIPRVAVEVLPQTLRGPVPAPTPPGRAPGTLVRHPQLSGRRGLPRGDQNVSRSFVVHNQRERILDAVANLTSDKGYALLTVDEISERAAISQSAFYEHFENKEDAFLVAYEVGHGKCLGAVERAYLAQPDWPGGVRAGIEALLGFLASEPAFARMALVDALIASPRAAARSDAGMSAFARMLLPREHDPGGAPTNAPAVMVEAVAGGIFELCLDHALRRRIEALPKLAPVLTFFALVPFIGDERAAAAATRAL